MTNLIDTELATAMHQLDHTVAGGLADWAYATGVAQTEGSPTLDEPLPAA